MAGAKMSSSSQTSGRCLPVEEWPVFDRIRWEEAFEATDILSANAVTARWSARSRYKTEKGYGRWLDWNLQRAGSIPGISPTARVTRERVAAYVGDLQAVNSSHTVQTRIQELADAMRVLAPDKDWRWLTAVGLRLRQQARSIRNKMARMQSPELLEALGLKLMTDADSDVSWPILRRATCYRDGLMIALLSRRPLRLKNLVALTIGRQLVVGETGYALIYTAAEMKNRQPYEIAIPAGLSGQLERYLTYWRRILLTRGSRQSAFATDALWISREGTPIGEQSVYHRIVKLTRKAFGQPVNPHLFRDCAATTVAIAAPEQVHDVPALLGHKDPSTANHYYNQARALDAGRRYSGIIDRYRQVARNSRYSKGSAS